MVNYVGVDWLTMTSDKQSSGLAWWNLYERYADSVKGEEPPPKEFSNGYYAGMRVGQVSWGYSDRLGWIFIASGEAANHVWHKAYPAAHRVTRVDLCMDVHVDVSVDLAGQSYELVEKSNGNNKRVYSLFVNNHSGRTLYVGSRHSTQFGRLYDKGVQADRAEAGHLWRYEVEYKKPLADTILDRKSTRLNSSHT